MFQHPGDVRGYRLRWLFGAANCEMPSRDIYRSFKVRSRRLASTYRVALTRACRNYAAPLRPTRQNYRQAPPPRRRALVEVLRRAAFPERRLVHWVAPRLERIMLYRGGPRLFGRYGSLLALDLSSLFVLACDHRMVFRTLLFCVYRI